MCPKLRLVLCALLALFAGALLCALLPGWLTVALLGAVSLAVSLLILFRKL